MNAAAVKAPSPIELNGAASQSELAALDVKVGNLDGDVREINDRLLGLDIKIDKLVAGLATEFRTSLASLVSQLSERNRTPWSVMIPAAAFLVTILGGIGWQALSPVRDELNVLKAAMVPRVEHEFRQQTLDRRFNEVERRVEKMEDRAYNEARQEVEQLRKALEAANTRRQP